MWQHPLAKGSPFWQMETTEVLQLLDSGHDGLKESQVKVRQKPERKTHPILREIRLFLKGFSDPLMMLLLAAVALSALLGDKAEALIISGILLSSSALTWALHSRAHRLTTRLEAMLSAQAQVIREGKPKLVLASEVVPGDLLMLKAGDILPADCLLLEANELHASESGFTGESFPIRKFPGKVPETTRLQQRHNALWKGSNIVSGAARALVIHTSEDTIFGEMVRSSAEVRLSGFESGLRNFGFFLLRITLLLSLMVLLINLFKQRDILDSTLFALALAVGMAPELLPAITTMAMSTGAVRLLEKQVIVKDIQSMQNLGEINLLCTDKTGTLTEGSIRTAGYINARGFEDAFVRELACINACLTSGYSNPMEEALRAGAGSLPDASLKTGEVPYDFIRRRVSISLKQGDGYRLICKGAFRNMLEICSMVQLPGGIKEPVEQWKEKLEAAWKDFGAQGLRCLLVAYREMPGPGAHKADEKDLVLAGFILFRDPVKPDAAAALEELGKLHVNIKILSGDSLPVLQSVASVIGLKGGSLSGPQLDQTSADALAHLLEHTVLFAELEPRHKERIIHALRKKHILAYMGDGINDVTALHAADVGISVNNAAGIAIEASDFVLLKKDLSVLADGIREGRRTFANTLKYIYISTGSTFGNMFSVALASLFLPFIPMLPKQILLTNFISDFPFLSVASDEVDAARLQYPGHWRLPVIRDFMLFFGLHSSLFDLLTFSFLRFGIQAEAVDFRTAWFMESVITEILILFVIRTHRPFYRSRPSGGLLWLGVLGIAFTLCLPWLPFAADLGLRPQALIMMAGILLILLLYLFSADWLKSWFFRHHRK